jgi:hypothetical protein
LLLKWALPLIVGYLGLVAAIIAIGAVVLFINGSAQLAGIAIFTALCYAIPAHGLYRRKKWARYLQVFVSLAFFGVGMIQAFTIHITVGALDIISHGLIAAYLLSEHCSIQFRPAIPLSDSVDQLLPTESEKPAE